MKKFTNVLNLGKVICNIFGWDALKMEVIRVKVQFGEWVSKDALIKNFFDAHSVRKFGEMQPNIKQLHKKSSLLFL